MARSDTRTTRARQAAFVATFVMAACAALHAEAAVPGTEASAAARFKAALIPLMAGTYGSKCMAVGPGGLGPGAAVIVGKDGRISAGPRSNNVVQQPYELFLQIERTKPSLNFSAQPVDPQVNSGYVIGYGSGGNAEVTASAGGGDPATNNVCSGGPLPPDAGADLWPIAATFIKIADKDDLCVDTRKGQQGGPVAFSASGLTIGNYALSSAAQRRSDTLIASDKSGGGFSYSATDAAGNVATFTIGIDGRFSGAELHRADDSWLSCGPRPH